MQGKFDKGLKICMGVLLLVAMVIVSAQLALHQTEEKLSVSSTKVLRRDDIEQGQKIVVLDAGHGGNDPGKVGINDTYEKDINLQITMKIKRYLEENDICVVMTRETDMGLYEEGASNKKVQDMKARVQIIDYSGADMAVSIHQNSFPQESVRGTQVFYYKNNEQSQMLAELMQSTVTELLNPIKVREAKANGDYYLLKKANTNVVIVECGFLSNSEEAAMLTDDEYQERMAWAISMGIMRCLSEME